MYVNVFSGCNISCRVAYGLSVFYNRRPFDYRPDGKFVSKWNLLAYNYQQFFPANIQGDFRTGLNHFHHRGSIVFC